MTLIIGTGTYNLTPINGSWSFVWNTSYASPNRFYHVDAICGDANDSLLVYVQDAAPPIITIVNPAPGAIIARQLLNVSGRCQDAGGIDTIIVRVDNGSWVNATGSVDWAAVVDCSGLGLGDHVVEARAMDTSGLWSAASVRIAVNESGQSWGPLINLVLQSPRAPVNTSNILFQANVTVGSPFALASVILWYSDGVSTQSATMYRYADFPVQSRHAEDPLRNLSNLPVYGCELGQFPSGTTVSYWVVACDTAGNQRQSEAGSFAVG
jgi:hypothetical protein